MTHCGGGKRVWIRFLFANRLVRNSILYFSVFNFFYVRKGTCQGSALVGIPKLFCRNTVHLGSSGSLSLVWNSPLRLCCLATQEAPRVSLSSFFSQDLDHKPTSAWAWLLLLLLFGCCSSCYCCCSVVVFLHRFWGLNPCPHACKASTLSTEPFFHPLF